MGRASKGPQGSGLPARSAARQREKAPTDRGAACGTWGEGARAANVAGNESQDPPNEARTWLSAAWFRPSQLEGRPAMGALPGRTLPSVAECGPRAGRIPLSELRAPLQEV